MVPNCKQCSTEMKLREKEGSRFWGCPNYKTCGGKTVPYSPVEQGFRPKFSPAKTNVSSQDPLAILADMVASLERSQQNQFQALNERFNGLAKFLQSNLGEGSEG